MDTQGTSGSHICHHGPHHAGIHTGGVRIQPPVGQTLKSGSFSLPWGSLLEYNGFTLCAAKFCTQLVLVSIILTLWLPAPCTQRRVTLVEGLHESTEGNLTTTNVLVGGASTTTTIAPMGPDLNIHVHVHLSPIKG